ncbi:putative reverse transcriptase domain-containing protein [Tanacetum coccineum]
MSKRNLATVTCSLAQNDLVDFVEEYGIPWCYDPKLPESHQMALDAPLGPDIPSLFGNSMSNVTSWKSEFIYVKETLISDLCPDLITNFRHGQGSFAYPYPKKPFDEVLWNLLCRHTLEAQTFSDPILYLAGLSSSWEHALSNPSIFVDGEEMAFRNFMKKPDQTPSFSVRPADQPVDVGSPSVEPLRSIADNDQAVSSSLSKDKGVSGFELAVVEEESKTVFLAIDELLCFFELILAIDSAMFYGKRGIANMERLFFGGKDSGEEGGGIPRQGASMAGEGSKKRRSITESLKEEVTVVRVMLKKKKLKVPRRMSARGSVPPPSAVSLFYVEEAHAAHNQIVGLHCTLLKDKLGFLSFDKLIDLFDITPHKFQVMVALVISISSDLSDESVGSSIPAAAVASPARVLELDTHSSSKRSRVASESSSPTTSTPEIPTAPIPPAPSAFVAPSTDIISPVNAPLGIRRQRAIVIRPGQDIPIGRLYCTDTGGPCRALTMRKLVRPLPSHRLSLRYTSHHLDHFTSGSSSGHSSLDHSSSGHSISGHSLYGHTPPVTTIADSSTPARFVYPPLVRTPRYSKAYRCWRSASLSTMYPLTTSESLAGDSFFESSARPSRKRCRSPAASVTSSIHASRALVPSRADLLPPCKRFRDSISPEDSVEEVINTDVLADIEADATAVEVAVDMDVEAEVDACIGMAVDVGVDVEDEVEGEVKSSDRGTIDVRVDVVARIDIPDGMHMPDAVEHLEHVEEVVRDIYGHVMELPLQRVEDIETGQRDDQDIGDIRCEAFGFSSMMLCMDFRLVVEPVIMTITHSGMNPEAIEELINQRVAEALAAYEANHAAKLAVESKSQNGDDEDNENVRGNGNENGRGNGDKNGRGNGNRNGGGNGNKILIGMIEVLCLSPVALTWWNAHKRTVGADAAFAMLWRELMKLMSERFQELTMMCTKMVPEEEDRVEKFIRGLLDNIQGNVIAAEPTRLQDVVRIDNNLMDQKLKGYAVKNVENKRRFNNNQKDNRVQQPPYKRQNVGGQSVARDYTDGNNEKRGFAGPLPYWNKSTQRAPVVNKRDPTYFKCGRQGHYMNEYPKLKNQTRGNKVGKKTNEARGKAYVLGGGEANPDSNIVTGTFILNNHYASMLFDSGADRSFMLSTFSALLDVIPSTLDISYAIELADGRVAETNIVLRGCTLRLLGHPFNIDLILVELGSFDVIIGIDWLVNHHAVIVCDEKIVRIPYGDEVFIVQVTKTETEDKSKEKRLEDVLIIRDFSEVFPEDFHGLLLTRQVEFQINLVHGVAPGSRAPYRLAPSEMQELSTQLQELSKKGFIRPSSSPWGAPVFFVKKK